VAGEVSEVIAKLREIEQQAFSTFVDLRKESIAYSRLRHIAILAKYARMKLEGVKVRALDTLAADNDGPSKPADKQ
jgi:hypothetical protein